MTPLEQQLIDLLEKQREEQEAERLKIYQMLNYLQEQNKALETLLNSIVLQIKSEHELKKKEMSTNNEVMNSIEELLKTFKVLEKEYNLN